MPDDALFDYTMQNRRAWNEIASVRAAIFPPAEFFARGGSTLDPQVCEAAREFFGDLRNLRVIHLQCATGEDTLSWAVLGALATGVDISDEQIELAKKKAAGANLPVRFIAADLYALPPDLLNSFDIVFTGGGALVWLPDLPRWAQVAASLLKPGGRLMLMDEHPISGVLWSENGQLKVVDDYFRRSQPLAETGWSHFKGAENAKETKYEFIWPLGDVLNALIKAGLVIERLEEFPGGPEWRFGENQAEAAQLPGAYLLVARK